MWSQTHKCKCSLTHESANRANRALQGQGWREQALSGMGNCTFAPVNCSLSGKQVKCHRSSSFSTEARYPDFYMIKKNDGSILQKHCSTNTVGVSPCRSAASDMLSLRDMMSFLNNLFLNSPQQLTLEPESIVDAWEMLVQLSRIPHPSQAKLLPQLTLCSL